MPIKEQITRTLHKLAANTLSPALAKRMPVGRVLMYHGIADGNVTAQTFERHLQGIRRHFKIVSLETIVDAYKQQSPELASMVAITFDDGLQNHFDPLYPLLQKYQAPATFFICPQLAKERRWIWNMELRCRLQNANPQKVDAIANELKAFTKPNPIESIVEHLKKKSLSDRMGLEAFIRNKIPEFNPTPQQTALCELMPLENLQKLDPKLITIGSHTLTHPILNSLTPAEVEAECTGSKARLENLLQRPVTTFCYPNGDFYAECSDIVARHYDIAVTTHPQYLPLHTADDPERIPSHLVPRLGGDCPWPDLIWRCHRHTA